MKRNQVGDWHPFPAPTMERVMFCGWNARNGNTQGYWWYEEGCTDDNGMPFDCQRALYWTPIALPPFPAKPEGAA